MLIHRIRGKGIGPLGAFALDLDALPGGIVAFKARNGSGKSFLVGAIPAAFYREVPTKGPLAGCATDRDSFLEVDATYRERFQIRQSVDAVSGKGEALVTVNGAPALATTKVTDADAWVREHLPPQEVYFSALFAPQQSAGFLDLSTGDRKGVILRVLGLEQYEALAETARANLKDAQERKAKVRTEEDLLVGSGGPTAVAFAQRTLEEAVKDEVQAGAFLGAARDTLQRAKEGHEELLAASRDAAAALRRHEEASRRASAARTAAAEALRKVVDAEAVAGRREAVDGALAQVKAAEEAMALASAKAKDLEALAQAAHKDAGTADVARQKAYDQVYSAEAQRKAVRAKLADRAKVEQALAELPALKEAVAAAEAEEVRTLAVHKALLEAVRTGTDGRIHGLRTGLEEVVRQLDDDDQEVGASRAAKVASGTLAADDRAIDPDLPQKVKDADKAHHDADCAARGARVALIDAQTLAARSREISELATREAELTAEIQKGQTEVGARLKEHAALVEEAKKHRAEAHDLLAASPDPGHEAFALAEQAPAVAAAEARLPDLREALRGATAEKEAAEAALATSPAPGTVPAVPDLRRHEEAVKAAEARHGAAGKALGTAEEALRAAQEAGRRLKAAQEAIAAIDGEIADWTRLAYDLGRKGLQALEIDAAGPELTAIVNDLLRQAFGTRYTLTLETTKQRKDGEAVEVFDIRAMDSENGWEGPATGLSGGQRTIVGEALRLALTTLACRKAKVSGCTLVRDESGAALDPENGVSYVAMLRRAMGLIGARQCLLISHDPQVWSLSDATVTIEDGRVVVL